MQPSKSCEMDIEGGSEETKHKAVVANLQSPEDKHVDRLEIKRVATRIRIACELRDISTLIDIASSPHGFVDDVTRCVACAAHSLINKST